MLGKLSKVLLLVVIVLCVSFLLMRFAQVMMDIGQEELKEGDFARNDHSGATDETLRDMKIVIINLNNGGLIKGVIQHEAPDAIMLDMGFGVTVVSRNDIYSINIPDEETAADIQKEWKDHVLQSGRSYSSTVQSVSTSAKDRAAAREEQAEAVRQRIADNEDIVRRDIGVSYHGKSRIIVPVRLNGKLDVFLLVDTGAPKVYLLPKIAKKLAGLNLSDAPIVKTKWVNDQVTEGRFIYLDAIKVGKKTANNIGTVVTEIPNLEDEADGLLGMSFLDNFQVNIDTEKRELVLKDK
jgi:predicted aspartyl protease